MANGPGPTPSNHVAQSVHLKFADGEYLFALTLERIRELQEKTGVGIGALYARVLQGRLAEKIDVGHPAYAAFHVDDVRQTILQGLIGGGSGRADGQDVTVSPLRAVELVDRYLGDPNGQPLMPLREQWDMAAAILFACVEGYEPEGETGQVDDDDADDEKKNKGGSTTPTP